MSEPTTEAGKRVQRQLEYLSLEPEASIAAKIAAIEAEAAQQNGSGHCAGCGNALHHEADHDEFGCQRCTCGQFAAWPEDVLRCAECRRPFDKADCGHRTLNGMRLAVRGDTR